MIGQIINGYKIIHKIGEGGMGEVYFAQDSLGQNAAIKVIRAEYCNRKDLKDRFITEIKTIIDLQGHPNIVALKSTTNINEPVIIMEYLDGEDLYQYIKRHKQLIEESTLIKWITQIVSALQFAHKRHIIHRDIKPSNIFITRFGIIKVLDFGIAKVIQQTNDDKLDSTLLDELTKTRTSLGAPQFMSPEQLYDPKLVTYLSDIYSFGKTLSYLATGGGNPLIKLSPRLHYVIKKCTEDDPSKRFQSWDELLKSLSIESLEEEGSNSSKLKIRSDIDCSITLDGDGPYILKKGDFCSFNLRTGKYSIKLTSVDCEQDFIEHIYEIDKLNIDYLYEVQLLPIRKKRLDSIAQQKKMEEEIKQAQIEAERAAILKKQKEEENRRLMEELAVKEAARKKEEEDRKVKESEYKIKLKPLNAKLNELKQVYKTWDAEQKKFLSIQDALKRENECLNRWQNSNVSEKFAIAKKEYESHYDWIQKEFKKLESLATVGWEKYPFWFKEYFRNFLFIITYPIRFVFLCFFLVVIIAVACPIYLISYPFYKIGYWFKLIGYVNNYKSKHSKQIQNFQRQIDRININECRYQMATISNECASVEKQLELLKIQYEKWI